MLYTLAAAGVNDPSSLEMDQLITLPFEQFLKEFARRHPVECKLVLGVADVSPESANAQKHADSWAFKLFTSSDITDHREFDRAALGLKYLHAALTGNREAFPISDANYNKIRTFLDENISGNEALYAWCWSLLFNDLGKIKTVADEFTKQTGETSADHDQIMVGILTKVPDYFPTAKDLGPIYLQALIDGLSTGFNFGKAAQNECPFVAWYPFRSLDQFTANFHFGHSFFDFLGVTGAFDPNTAKPFILNDNNVTAYFSVAEFRAPAKYSRYRLELLGETLPAVGMPFDVSLSRLVGMLRIFTKDKFNQLVKTIETLPPQVMAIIDDELSISGYDMVTAIEPHYGPALFDSAQKIHPECGVGEALITLARVFFDARRLVKDNSKKMIIVNLNDLATAIAKDANAFTKPYSFEPTDDGFRLRMKEHQVPNPDNFPAEDIKTLLAGKTSVFIGIGGGSDGLQAAIAGLESGSDLLAVISIRSPRSVENAEELVPGVFKITPKTTGSSRFLENLAAELIPTYLVSYVENQAVLRCRIEAILNSFNPDVVVGVDTGGDALYRNVLGVDEVYATPDQDLFVLETLKTITGQTIFTLELAVGVDAPAYAEEILRAGNAQRFTFDDDAAQRIIDRYLDWETKIPWIGKTPLALCASRICEQEATRL